MGGADQPATRRRAWGRAALVVAVVLAVLVGSGLVLYRVFAPAEVVAPATRPYPAKPPTATPGVIGTLAAAPLIVDGRLRVYATTRQIRADLPVDARTQRSPFWSYRRWPAQVTGVVAVGTTVVGRWSDGLLVGLDARTGRVAWKAAGPAPQTAAYTGRRTGAATVYDPDGLLTTGGIVISRGAREVIAVDAAGGRTRWRLADPPARDCRLGEFTTAAGRYAVADSCANTLNLHDAATGRLATAWQAVASATPLGCRVGHSQCAGMRVERAGAAEGWLLRGAEPTRAPVLDGADTWLAEDVAMSPGTSGDLVGRRASDGGRLWIWRPGTVAPEGRARVIAAQPGRVHLLTAGYTLVTLDAETGVELSRFLFTYGRERTGWELGFAYAAHGFVLVERLTAGVPATAPDDEFYFIAQPVLLAGT
jgi:hypothetical protein